MASLKRYRQTTDNNAAARFRDLPPRFKRQKSVPSSDSNTTESPKQSQTSKPKKSPEDFICSEVVKDHAIPKDKKSMKKGSGSRPLLTVEFNRAKRTAQPIVLSPMDNKLFNLIRNDNQDLSVEDYNNPFSWQNEHLPWSHHRPTNEQTNIFQTETMSYSGPWTTVSNMHQTTEKPQVSNTFQSASLPTAGPYPEIRAEPAQDYSEKDSRIIEMLKELERVADEKEKEEDKSGTDRKSLVSHHLRMLMCAMDKYTEGIDDETYFEGRNDEVQSEERSSPFLPDPVEIVETSVSPKGNSGNHHPPQLSNRGSFPKSELETVRPVYVHSSNSSPVQVTCHSKYQQVPHYAYTLDQGNGFQLSSKSNPILPLTTSEIPPWDLWSSTSFNGLDVYSYLSKGHDSSETADLTFALFDQLGMENDYSPRTEECFTRTPLYRR